MKLKTKIIAMLAAAFTCYGIAGYLIQHRVIFRRFLSVETEHRAFLLLLLAGAGIFFLAYIFLQRTVVGPLAAVAGRIDSEKTKGGDRSGGSVVRATGGCLSPGELAGELAVFSGACADIVAPGAAGHALEREVARFRRMGEAVRHYEAIIEASCDLITLVDADFRHLVVNSGYRQATGLEGLVGQSMLNAFGSDGPPEGLAGGLSECLSGGIVRFGTWTRFQAQERCYMDVSLFPCRDREGPVTAIVVNFRDATFEREASERDLAEQKMTAVESLASGLAHDFNNLLMGILGNISLMKMKTAPTGFYYRKFQAIESLIQGGSDLTRLLLGFARGGKYESRVTSLNSLIRKNLAPLEKTLTKVSICESCQKDLWGVAVDRSQISQVFSSLFMNGCQAMTDGGNLGVSTRNVTLSKAEASSFGLSAGNHVKVSVRDNGLGMDRKTLDRIFDPFFTTKKIGRGNGLGLAAAYGIVRNHDGMIMAHSRPGQGTVFDIYLPASDKEIAREVEPKVARVVRGAETVLLVDDEEFILDVGKQILSQLGYEVVVAHGGMEAIDRYREKRGDIAIVILDMVMPGMDGGETYDRLKLIDPQVKVLIATGFSLTDKAAEIMARGCSGFIQKPFGVEQFSATLREVLDQEEKAHDTHL